MSRAKFEQQPMQCVNPKPPKLRLPGLRHERHFGDRVLLCFAQHPGSVTQMLADAVTRNGAGEALVCGDDRFSWQQLDVLSARLAGALHWQGVVVGDRVALLLDNGAPFVLAVLACAKLGAIVVPLGVRSQTPELAYALNDCGAVLVIADAALTARLPATDETPGLHNCWTVQTEALPRNANGKLMKRVLRQELVHLTATKPTP